MFVAHYYSYLGGDRADLLRPVDSSGRPFFQLRLRGFFSTDAGGPHRKIHVCEAAQDGQVAFSADQQRAIGPMQAHEGRGLDYKRCSPNPT